MGPLWTPKITSFWLHFSVYFGSRFLVTFTAVFGPHLDTILAPRTLQKTAQGAEIKHSFSSRWSSKMRVWPCLGRLPRRPKTLAKSSLIFDRCMDGLGATLRLHFELILGSKIHSDFISIFTSKNGAKMAPKSEGKI